MAVSYQLVVDCTSPDLLARFWAEALRYVLAPTPPGFESWDDRYASVGVPEDELGPGADRIEDPTGDGPGIWFQVVPERKSLKNRLHIGIKRQRRPRCAPRDPPRAGRGRSGPARGARCDAAAHGRRRGAGPLRGGDGRSRGQ